MAHPSRNAPVFPSTALAPRHPPYIAPVTDGKKASDPAKKRPGISVYGVVVYMKIQGVHKMAPKRKEVII